MPADHSAPVTTIDLVLRPVSIADTDAIFRIHSDPATNVHNPDGPMSSYEQAIAKAQLWTADWADAGIGYWAVALREDQRSSRKLPAETDSLHEAIGFAGIRQSDWAGRRVYNLAYRFTPSTWGNGYAAQAASAAVSTWRAVTQQLPLVAYTLPRNIGSQKTALRAGLIRSPQFDVVSEGLTEICFALDPE